MPKPAHQIDHPLTRDERKELLIVACRADRVAWSHACRPRPQAPAQLAGRILHMLEPVISLLPGRVGGWLRGVKNLASIGRQFGLLAS